MFMNLVKLKHAHLALKEEEEEEDDKTIVEGKDSDRSSSDSEDEAVHKKEKKSITSIDVMTHLQRKTTNQLQSIHQLTIKLDRVKESSYYTQELVELEHSLDHLIEHTHHVQQN